MLALRPGSRPVTDVTIEAIVGNDTVLSTPVTLPRPDDMGTIRIVGELPTAGLGPGQYTLRVVVNDGQAMASRAADVTLAP